MPFKRYEVQGPFHRRGQRRYWLVFDKVGKQVVLTSPRSSECYRKVAELEQATSAGGS